MTAIEAVWYRMKEHAAQHAQRSEPLDRNRAEAVVVRLLQDARIAPWPPAAVINFYVNELLAMTEKQQLTTAAREQ